MDKDERQNGGAGNDDIPVSNGERRPDPNAMTKSFKPIDRGAVQGADTIGGDAADEPDVYADEGEPLSSTKKFLITVAAVVGVFLVLSGALVIAYSAMRGNNGVTADGGGAVVQPADKGDFAPIATNAPTKPEAAEPSGNNWFDDLFAPQRKTNVLIIGVDQEGYLADVNIVAGYDALTQKVTMLSVPRDTYLEIEQADIDAIRARNAAFPKDGKVKLTDLHAYAGKVDGHIYNKKYIEKILGITIDYYVKIDIRAFRKVVDEIGGVYMTVRPQGYDYEDPDQNLKIKIPGGYQLLDGKNAEGVVRYRDDYRNGDIDRIVVQQTFMKAFFEQALSKQAIVNNLASYYTVMKDYVQTDFGADKFLLYAESLTKIPSDGFSFFTLPGEGFEAWPNGVHVWYFRYSPSRTMELVAKELNNYDLPETPTVGAATAAPTATPAPKELKAMRIQVLNGGSVDGMATRVRDALRAEGYTVTSLGNYKGTKTKDTRIFTRYDADVSKLTEFFNTDVAVAVDGDMGAAYDIVIIIGEDEK